MAIRRLRDFESKSPHRYINIISDINCCIADPLLGLGPDANYSTVDRRMEDAKANDERMKKKSRNVCEAPSVAPPPPHPQSSDLMMARWKSLSFTFCNLFLTRTQSLCDVSGDFSTLCPYLTPVPEALRSAADIRDLPEVLWNFGHFKDEKRLTLAQNPHFYGNLPESPHDYGQTFRRNCIENSLPNKIFVPTNHNSRRVYFDFPGNRRVFDVWKTKSALIFKGLSFALLILPPADIFLDVRGDLEGETYIENSMRAHTPPFKYHKGRPQVEVGTTDDWRDLIRTEEDTTCTYIRVSASDT